MPYAWESGVAGPPERLELWPNRSLPAEGFAGFILATFVLLMVPVVALLGHPALWALLPFVLGALALTWVLIRRQGRDALATRETLTLGPGRVELIRLDPGGRRRAWQANPYWVRVQLHKSGGPVENYLTLKGGDREVEIGAFLSPQERVALKPELEDALRRL